MTKIQKGNRSGLHGVGCNCGRLQAGHLYPTVSKFITGRKTGSICKSTPYVRGVAACIPGQFNWA